MTGAEQEALMARIRKSWEMAAKRKACRKRWWEQKQADKLRRMVAGTRGGRHGKKQK